MAKKKSPPKKKTAKKKSATKKSPPKKSAGKKPTKVIDEPLNIVYYKQGDLIDNFELLEEAAARSKKKEPMPFAIQWETDSEEITLQIFGEIALERKKKKR